MDIDSLDALEALGRMDVRVARSKYVDSAEDAIAFAERRNAKDPRLVPIVLRHANERKAEPLASEAAISRAYHQLEHAPGRLMAQVALPHGDEFILVGETAPTGAKTLTVEGRSAKPTVPIGSDGAQALALEVLAYEHREPPKTEHMLEHLFARVSKFFEGPKLQMLRVNVRLHEGTYTVTDVAAVATGPLHLEPMLGKRAHDRKGDEYRVPGRQ
jgi:hypothetical protein